MKASVEHVYGEQVIVVRGPLGVVYTSGPVTLDPKEPRTRMEIEHARFHTSVSYGDLYDAIRAAQRRRSSLA